MSAAAARRAPSRASRRKVAVPKKIAKRLPVDQARANKLAGLVFGGFLLAIGVVVAGRARHSGQGRARRRRGGRRRRLHASAATRSSASTTWTARWSTRSSTTSCTAPPTRRVAPRRRRPLVDVAAIRERLLQFGWVKDARVSRRLPDTLVIDIVERTPAALWQNQRPAGADRRAKAWCSTACRSTRCPTCRC